MLDLELLGVGWAFPIQNKFSTHTNCTLLGSTFLVLRSHARYQAILSRLALYHCSSFPTILLQLIRTGARLSQPDYSGISPYPSAGSKQEKVLVLLHTAQSFSPLAWATNLQPRSPPCDRSRRTHIAFAHRAAVCIYLSRVVISLDPTTQFPHDLELLEVDVIAHLSLIRPNDALFAATTWPAFIAGAEVTDRGKQEWVAERFQELWRVEPWGLIRGAFEVLENIWKRRRSGVVADMEENLPMRKGGDGEWTKESRESGVAWLIL